MSLQLQHIKNFSLQNIRRINGNQGYRENRNASDNAEIPPTEIYELAQINLFIGKNGSGKSTILDMLNCIRDPGNLGTMPRDNMKRHMHAYFEVTGESFGLRVDFPSTASTIDKYKYGYSEYQEAHIKGYFDFIKFTYIRHLNKYSHEQPSYDVNFKCFPVQIWHSSQAIDIDTLEKRHVDG